MAGLVLEPVKDNKAYLQIVNYIVHQISTGKLDYGQTLYTEQELTKSLNVSRPTLREALRVLEFLGIITVKRRNGIQINSPADIKGYSPLLYLMLFDKINDVELFELREAIQTSMVQSAAMYRTDEDLARLRDNLEEMEQLISLPDIDPGQFADIDNRFHSNVMRCAGNLLCVRLMDTLSETLRLQSEETNRSLKSYLMVFQEHRLIYDCIEKRDGASAYEHMRNHLKGAGQYFSSTKRSHISNALFE